MRDRRDLRTSHMGAADTQWAQHAGALSLAARAQHVAFTRGRRSCQQLLFDSARTACACREQQGGITWRRAASTAKELTTAPVCGGGTGRRAGASGARSASPPACMQAGNWTHSGRGLPTQCRARGEPYKSGTQTTASLNMQVRCRIVEAAAFSDQIQALVCPVSLPPK